MTFVGIVSFFLFLFFQAQGIYGGDSGDLVTAAVSFGVPHPPGYPLYTLLGWVVSRFPWSSPAWRVGLLSSIPHAITVVMVYALVVRLTKQKTAGVFAAAALAGNYLFFLYSVTPEVFALFDVFIVSLTYLLILWSETKESKYMYLASFVFGLSLSHHHVILFLVPALAYWVYMHKQLLHRHSLIRLFAYWLIGLLPYLYLPIAGNGASIINWNRPADVTSFVRLITRADYGTFVSGGYYGNLISQRITQVKAYGQFILLDWTALGIALALIGFVWLWITRRQVFWFLLLALVFLGPGFFFYASFPLVNRFTLGTYERFLLPSYTLLATAMGLGVAAVIHFSLKRSRLFRLGVLIVLFCLPAIMFAMTIWRFWGLSTDMTADALGQDILASVDPHSILFLSRDTPLFTTEYMRYAVGFRTDVMAIHASRLATSDYPRVLARAFPDLVIPEKTGETFLPELVRLNRERYPIFSVYPLSVGAGLAWVQEGLVYRLISESKAPAADVALATNDRLWSSYHDPRIGLLARYRHLMLADVLDVYAGASVDFGKMLLRIGKLADAKRYFSRAIDLDGDTQLPDAHTYAGLTDLFLKDCTSALSHFAAAKTADLARSNAKFSLYEGITMRDCVGDADRATSLLDEYERLKKQEETPL